MTCRVEFEVDEETADAIVESIDESVASGEDAWSFEGDFSIPAALQIRNDLQRQLERDGE